MVGVRASGDVISAIARGVLTIQNAASKREVKMTTRWIASLILGLMLGGCMQTTLSPAPETSMKPRDRSLLANPPYDTSRPIPEEFRRHLVDYHRREAPGTIVVDQD